MDESDLDALIARMREEITSDPYGRIEPFLRLGSELLDGGHPLQARRVFGEIIADVANLPPSVRRDQAQSTAWYNIAIAAGGCGNVDEEIGIYARLVERFGDAQDLHVRTILARALFNKANKLAQSGRQAEAVGEFEEVATRFIEAPEPEIRAEVAMAICQGGATRGRLGHPQDELRAYDRMLALFGGDPHPVLRRLVAMTLYGKAAAVGRLGRRDEVLLVIDELMKRFGDDSDPAIRKVIADAEESQRRFADATMTADPYYVQLAELIERESLEKVSAFADAILVGCSDPAHVVFGELVSWAMLAPAFALTRQGRLDEASHALAAVIHHLDEPRAPAMHRVLAIVVANLTKRLRAQERFRECIEVADLLLTRSPDVHVDIDVALAEVLFYKAESLAGIGEREAAVETCADALRFPAAGEPRLHLFVAQALFYRGFLLSELDRADEAIAALTEMSSRFADDRQPDVLRLVFGAMVHKRFILGQQRRLPEMVAVSEELIERFGDAAEPDMRLDVARVAFETILALRELGERRKAIAACDTYARFADVAHPAAHLSVARALLNKGVILSELGHMHEAVQTCDEIITDSANDADPALRPIIAIALRNKGSMLEQLARPEAASDVYAELAARFAGDDEPQVLEQVTVARERLALLRTPER